MARDERAGGVLLGDTDLFFFYLRGGTFQAQAEGVIKEATSGRVDLKTSSEVYDDAISAIRADGVSLEVAHSFVSDMRSIPHTPLPTSAEIAEEAMSVYLRYGGRRKLSYFDSFHVATAKRYALELLTSDQYIIENARVLGIQVRDLSLWKP